ncbi:MAG: hypothetical protein HY231_25260 [Acidobacteria bacterium]|nr:hypothetical protein [Acidobacteriota bacterium]
MKEPTDQDFDFDNESLFSKRRLRNMIIGAVLAVVLGLALANLYTYTQYGGTMFDSYFRKEKPPSPAAGKFAYAKGTGDYVGIIRGEGTSPRRGQVYFIEQPGGQMMEAPKDKVEVREPTKE